MEEKKLFGSSTPEEYQKQLAEDYADYSDKTIAKLTEKEYEATKAASEAAWCDAYLFNEI